MLTGDKYEISKNISYNFKLFHNNLIILEIEKNITKSEFKKI